MIEPGMRVVVRYDFQPSIIALVLETPPEDVRFGWRLVEQISDYEDEAARPRFLALETMMREAPQTTPPASAEQG